MGTTIHVEQLENRSPFNRAPSGAVVWPDSSAPQLYDPRGGPTKGSDDAYRVVVWFSRIFIPQYALPAPLVGPDKCSSAHSSGHTPRTGADEMPTCPRPNLPRARRTSVFCNFCATASPASVARARHDRVAEDSHRACAVRSRASALRIGVVRSSAKRLPCVELSATNRRQRSVRLAADECRIILADVSGTDFRPALRGRRKLSIFVRGVLTSMS